jgi:hypothetical protein
MALWGKTDAAGSKPKYLSVADKAKTVFVSAEEALLATNKKKGITGAGWWLMNEYTDASGATRYKAECLVAMTVANATSGDAADDATVADVEVTITISAQPTGQDTSSGAATFSVTASASSGNVTYQWQRRLAGATRWTNVSGATSSSLVLSGQVAGNDNDAYRVVLGSDSGAVKVNSNAATLNYVS